MVISNTSHGVPKLKEHKVSVDNKPHLVRLARVEERLPFSVEIDGKTCQVVLLNELKADKPFPVKVNGRTYKVELSVFNGDAPFFIRVNNKPYKVQYETRRMPHASTRIREPTSTLVGKQPSIKPAVGKENAVTAPMPGIVVALKAKIGASVHLGQSLCILEAMKMENEITASKAGVVKEIHVSEGSSVSQGQPLIVIE